MPNNFVFIVKCKERDKGGVFSPFREVAWVRIQRPYVARFRSLLRELNFSPGIFLFPAIVIRGD